LYANILVGTAMVYLSMIFFYLTIKAISMYDITILHQDGNLRRVYQHFRETERATTALKMASLSTVSV